MHPSLANGAPCLIVEPWTGYHASAQLWTMNLKPWTSNCCVGNTDIDCFPRNQLGIWVTPDDTVWTVTSPWSLGFSADTPWVPLQSPWILVYLDTTLISFLLIRVRVTAQCSDDTLVWTAATLIALNGDRLQFPWYIDCSLIVSAPQALFEFFTSTDLGVTAIWLLFEEIATSMALFCMTTTPLDLG